MRGRAPKTDGPSLCSAHGPRALEELFLTDLRAHVERGRRDPSLLASPLVVVVPSRSLRLHLASACLRAVGGALVGVRIQTLFGLARDLHERAGLAPPRGARLFDTLVRECARAESTLAGELSALEEGENAAAATLADLFDAGFEAPHAAAFLELLAAPETAALATPRELRRAAAITRTAAAAARALDRLGLGRPSLVLRRAAEIVRAERAGATRNIHWIHGFTDATGSAADLLEALAAGPAARVYWDSCADGRFGAGLRARFGLETAAAASIEGAQVELVRASSVDGEVRAAAERVRAALAAGTDPETIGIVARDLEPYCTAIRTHFGRLAIPFSGLSPIGPGAAPERRAHALSALLESGVEAPVERWLDARAPRIRAPQAATDLDLDLALRALGAGRVATFAALDLAARLRGREELKLPLRAVTTRREEAEEDAAEEAGDGEDAADSRADETDPTSDPTASGRRLAQRSVGRADLEGEQRDARALVESFTHWPAHAPLRVHAAELGAFVAGALGWKEDTPGAGVLARALELIGDDLQGQIELDRASFLRLARGALEEAARAPLGGRGGGVQVLSVVEARGRTFAHLHVLGSNRGRFPRHVREDPLLSDALRESLGAVLPDLPVKSVGRDEERCLFDQLARSSPSVTLSWLTLDAEGKALLSSPLLERVATPARIATAPLAPTLFPLDPQAAETASAGGAPRPAHERAVLASLARGRRGLAETALAALCEARIEAELSTDRATEISAARVAILAEHEGPRTERPELGPYFGFVGTLCSQEDPRTQELWVTTLEGLRRCGWQTLLTRILKIEPAPDPMAALPGVDPLLVGVVVHAVLQQVYGRGPQDIEATRTAEPRAVDWPSDVEVARILLDRARAALSEQGVLLPGLEHLVAERARGPVLAARALDQAERSAIEGTFGAEIDGAIELLESALGPRTLGFRADRVDRVDGALRLTDYKTGKPISDKIKPETRHAHHVNEIASGKRLQSMVYAISAGPAGTGRYVFLGERVAEDARVFAVRADETGLRAHYDRAVETILKTWDLGAFFPRMLQKDLVHGNDACASCEMVRACLRGDTASHTRLAEFVRASDPRADAEQAVLDLWSLEQEKS